MKQRQVGGGGAGGAAGRAGGGVGGGTVLFRQNAVELSLHLASVKPCHFVGDAEVGSNYII